MTLPEVHSRYLPLLSGILLTLSFPPFHLLLPSFIALVPMLYYLERAGSRREVVTGSLILGLVHNVSLLYWTAIFTWTGFFVLMIYLTLYCIVWCFTHYYLWRRSRWLALVVAPFSWVFLEYYKGIGEIAFTWGQLSYSLTCFPLLIQFADTVGPYGISLWIAIVNVLIYVFVRATSRRDRLISCAVLGLTFAVVIFYGLYRFNSFEPSGSISVGIVQPGLDQDTKWDPAFQDSTIEILSEQTREVHAAGADLIVWPETSVPTYLKYDLITMTTLSDLARELACTIILGAPHYEVRKGEYRSYNIALAYDSTGRLSDRIYKKIHLVPFGERTPWEDDFDFLKDVDLGGGHFTAGSELTMFTYGSLNVGTLICFESIFPELARSWRLEGADFLVNITNDAWFERTSAPYQHASAVVLRAIENRISIARAANTGVSLTVDPMGRVRKSTGIFVRTTLNDTLPLTHTKTLYTRLGDIVVLPSLLILLTGMLIGRFLDIKEAT